MAYKVGGVTLQPDASARNVILPASAAATAITLKAHASQSANLMEVQTNGGSATERFRVLATGVPSCPGSGASSERFGLSSVASGTRATVFGGTASATQDDSTAIGNSASANHASCVMLGRAATSSAAGEFCVSSQTGITNTYIGLVGSTTGGAAINTAIQPSGATGTNIAGATFTLAGGKATGNAAGGDLLFSTSDAGSSGTTLQTLREKWRIVNNTGEWRASLFSSTTNREVFSILPSYVVSTDASRTTRAVLAVTDFGGERECIRLESSGTAAMVGFLGAAAVVRQTGASAAGIAAITDANALAAISALQTALANLGLVTSPA